MQGRRSLSAAVVIIGLLAVLLAGFWLWGRPRESVAMPSPRATPAAVVRTYVRALDERDFATSNALQPYGSESHWWTPNPPTITRLRITHAGTVGPGARLDIAGASSWKQGVEVDTTSNFNNFSGMEDGSAPWEYFLVRNSDSQSWRVIDWGQG